MDLDPGWIHPIDYWTVNCKGITQMIVPLFLNLGIGFLLYTLV